MVTLTSKQQRLLAELRRRSAFTTADCVERAWLRGEPAFLDTRGRGGRGLGPLFKRANKVKQA